MSRHWQKVRLGEVLRYTPRPVTPGLDEEYREIGIRSHGRGIFHKRPTSGAEIGDKRVFCIEPGDFVLNIVFAWEGAVAIAGPAEQGMIGSHRFPTFRAAQGLLDPAFLLLYFRTPAGIETLRRVSPGGAGRNRTLNRTAFLDQEIPLPPLAEQRRIVARIEELAGQIAKVRVLREQSSAEAGALIATETSRIVDQSLDGARQPIRTLGKNEENPIQIGPFGAQLHKSEFVESGIAVLNVGNVWPEGLRLTSLDYVTPGKAERLSRYRIGTGDLLFARSGATLGKVCLVPEECDGYLMTGHLFRVRFDETRVFNRFAFALLRGSAQIQEQVFGQVRGATRPGYNTTLLSAVELPIPPIAEQRRIVAKLDALQAEVDALKRHQAETAAELDALLPAILDRAFRGEL